jgi:hypothetical protein
MICWFSSLLVCEELLEEDEEGEGESKKKEKKIDR